MGLCQNRHDNNVNPDDYENIFSIKAKLKKQNVQVNGLFWHQKDGFPETPYSVDKAIIGYTNAKRKGKILAFWWSVFRL